MSSRILRQQKCSFCGKDIPLSKGFSYVRNDGTIYYFCRSKCKISLVDFKRNPRKLKWTNKYEKRSG